MMVSTCGLENDNSASAGVSLSIAGCWYERSYHGLGGEGLDLLDGLRSPLLEGDTMEL